MAKFRSNQMAQQARASVDSLPAPVGGWNARDSLADMAPTDAVILENWFPSTSSVDLRDGYSNWATGMNGQVESLMVYAGAQADSLFAVDAVGLNIYDITAGGAVGTPVVTGLSNARWEYANIATAGGNFMMCVNGIDSLKRFDGTTWLSIIGTGTGAITGVATTSLSNVILFKNRLWFIEKNTLHAWYLPTSSIAGAASEFDLGAIARDGGVLVAMGTWTIDAGYGVDDNLVFITSKGEVIVYAGTDPASPSTWALIGVWQLGYPVGTRCLIKWAGDLLVLTYDGLLPLAASLQSSRLDPRVALSNKIQNAISVASTTYGSTFGWEIFYFPRENAVWVNVPVQVGSQQQYVMNTITRSWCNFTGWAANCWELFKNDPYFGANGIVAKAFNQTYADNSANINTSALQAFNYFESRGTEKYFTRARPSIFTNGMPAISIGMNVNFNIVDNLAPVSFSPASSAVWDVSLLDVGTWGQSSAINSNWQGITGIGYCGAVQFKSASQGLTIQWAATDVVYQQGWAGI